MKNAKAKGLHDDCHFLNIIDQRFAILLTLKGHKVLLK
ncbi:MAG: hypothetical protein ACJAU1_000022 [Psychromonas sp.]|jgi:hypothetical protein